MKFFAAFCDKITDPTQRQRMEEILAWVATTYEDLTPRIAWNQPLFTHHSTFIIGFSVSKKHIAVAPEHKCIEHFIEDIKESDYAYSSELIKITWVDQVNFDLLEKLIDYNIKDKATCKTFWRTE